MPAAYYAVSYVVSFQTIDPKLGCKVLVEIEIGGCGALPYADGASAHAFGMHNNSNIPVEMIEGDTPITVLGYGLIQDSGGPGRQRGGLGLWREWRIDSAEAWLTTNLDRFRFPPFGCDGGLPARLSALYLIRDGKRQALSSKLTNLTLRQGDIVRLETSGGGGFGDPKARPRAVVTGDVRQGYVSTDQAAQAYGMSTE
jgi:N-methylhydantoinase B/oxoprolinase/acetone carboxylase alpha subunit